MQKEHWRVIFWCQLHSMGQRGTSLGLVPKIWSRGHLKHHPKISGCYHQTLHVNCNWASHSSHPHSKVRLLWDPCLCRFAGLQARFYLFGDLLVAKHATFCPLIADCSLRWLVPCSASSKHTACRHREWRFSCSIGPYLGSWLWRTGELDSWSLVGRKLHSSVETQLHW